MPQLFATEKAVGYAQVAVERGVDQYPEGLSYGIPQELASVKPGHRVIVPLGRGDTLTPGYIIEISKTTSLDPEHIKFIRKADDAGVQLTAQLLELARWISNYYCAPIGMTLASMLPAAVKKNVGAVRKTMVDLGDPLPLNEKLPAKQKHVLQTLAALPPDKRPVEIRALAELAELQTIGPIKKLIDRKLIETSRRSVIEAQWSSQAIDQRVPEQLTDEQQQAIGSIGQTLNAGFSTQLLFGVTGSGKTEVYIRLIERVLAQGRCALMLVPEISLTPQTGGRLIGRFPNRRVAVLHSGLTSAQRHQQWALAAEASANGADIVLGARSAVFAPIPDDRLGLIIVDEEHDSSYKQDQSPRYHGRDVAIRRAQLAKCPIVLGSATPSLESWHNATRPDRPTSTLHRLTHRAPGLRLPKVQVLDFRQQSRERNDKHVHLLGPALESAIARTLDADGQALILLNRRGYASYIACPSTHCGWIMNCDHCDVTVVYHRNMKLPPAGGVGGGAGGYVRCHHCLSEQKLPPACPQCGKKISIFGLGTQRIEEELTRKFPLLIEGKTLLRIDSDTMGGSRDFHSALSRFGSGEVRVLLGTQMIAKGLDFPGVRLVGVINADTSINLPDFRASERTFQLVNQVAGRCGRGADAGLTIVQTFNPSTPAIRFAAAHDFVSFAKQELQEREQSGLPPWTRMTRIVVRDEDHVKCIAAARELAKGLSAIGHQLSASVAENRKPMAHSPTSNSPPTIRLRGPAPCPIARIADKHRQQIEILAPTAALMQRFLTQARTAGLIKSSEEMAVDVDPTALL